jgi:hypothetical protein
MARTHGRGPRTGKPSPQGPNEWVEKLTVCNTLRYFRPTARLMAGGDALRHMRPESPGLFDVFILAVHNLVHKRGYETRSFWRADHDELRVVFIMQLPLGLGDLVLSVFALFL